MPFRLEISEFLDGGVIKKELISDFGENNVKEVADFLSRKVDGNHDNPITTNQLRKFYDSFLKIYFTKIDVESKKVQLLLLKAQVEYSVKRLNIKRFGKFINNRVGVVLNKNGDDFEKNFEAFKLHFEALIGYFPKN